MASLSTVAYRIVGHEVVSKLSGVTFDGRPDKIKRLTKGDVLKLVPTPHPKHEQAIIVYARNSNNNNRIDIGYLPRELADIVHQNFLDNGNPENVIGVVLEITGGFGVDISTGVVIGFTMPSGRKI